jgi:hypothetical protein
MQTGAPWPTEVGPNWPPYLCKRCWGMCFIYNIRMAQCCYCQHTYLNWSRHEYGSVAPDT